MSRLLLRILKGAAKAALLAFICSAAILSSSACARKKAPEPPTAKAELLLDIYASIAQGDHKAAFNKILRYREIDKNSIFLTELESIERNNMYLVEARRLLDAGDIAGASKLLDGAVKRHGQQDELQTAQAELAALQELASLIEVIKEPKSAAAMKAAAARLLALSASFKLAAPFAPFAREGMAKAARLERFEAGMTLFDLRSDADILFESGSADAPSLLAELAVEQPLLPALKTRLGSLQAFPGVRQKTPRK